MQEQLIHHLVTSRLQHADEYGWEFSCTECTYRAQYRIIEDTDQLEFAIIDIGDSNARHMSRAMSPGYAAADPEGGPVYPVSDSADRDDPAGEEWLTPALREQIEQILRDLGFD